VEAGAQVVTGGAPVDGPGYFYQPTVLGNVPNDAEILRNEIFGPVAPVTTFATEEDAIALANASEYGLASYLYTRDYARMFRVAEQIEFGMVGFNAGVISNAAAPFGGVKQSGLGREGGAEGLAEYTTVQYIGIADPYAK
jgi:succinate-semialdehyde dehydrogenase/glutarate-semialdehyde dehydrogenase